jgi:hypothetical protein
MRKGEEQAAEASRSQEELSRSAALYLRLVLENEFPIPMFELLKTSGMGVEDFVAGLGAMQSAGLVVTQRDDRGQELVELTQQGKLFKSVGAV